MACVIAWFINYGAAFACAATARKPWKFYSKNLLGARGCEKLLYYEVYSWPACKFSINQGFSIKLIQPEVAVLARSCCFLESARRSKVCIHLIFDYLQYCVQEAVSKSFYEFIRASLIIDINDRYVFLKFGNASSEKLKTFSFNLACRFFNETRRWWSKGQRVHTSTQLPSDSSHKLSCKKIKLK